MARVSKLSARCRIHFPASSVVCLDILLVLLITAGATASGQSLPGCPSKCGDVEVPYPFGISRGCSRDETFLLTCNQTSDGISPPRLNARGGIPIFNISILQGYLDVSLFFVRNCYKIRGKKVIETFNNSPLNLSLPPPLSISPGRNRFIVTGCDAYVWYYSNIKDDDLWTGCQSGCGSLASIVNNTCNGFGCCECNMPKGLRDVQVNVSFDNDGQRSRRASAFNPCNYVFIVDRDKFVFNTSWIREDYSIKTAPQIPAVLDWSIEGDNCTTASISGGNGSTRASTYACVSANSECVTSRNGLGYLCNCSAGYAGNPYLKGGCQDIDECKLDRQIYPCYGICTNVPGNYSCSCPKGSDSDDPKQIPCRSSGLSLPSKVLIGIGSGVLFLCIIILVSILIIQKRKLQQFRQKCFQQNGGVFLQQSIQYHQQTSFKIFTMMEMEKATHNFDPSFILGKGGFGAVYKGILDDGRIVAVKKSIMVEEKMNEEYAKELFILSQINHKNIVKLLGCCLECEVPMLVYEYICNGTLFDYLHKQNHNDQIPFSSHLKIAIESAEALRYLHTDASPTILHGDVKSSNILLDEDFIPKVADFGTSILAPKDKAQFTTLVQGTYGYLDPEYLQSSKLTDKSDVYSFGVVLLELLTRKQPLYFEGQQERNLVSIFISKMRDDKLIDIVPHNFMKDYNLMEVNGVAELALQCLCLSGKDRPSMKEVVTMLENLYKLNYQSHGIQNIQGVDMTLESQENYELDVGQVTTEVQSLVKIGGR